MMRARQAAADGVAQHAEQTLRAAAKAVYFNAQSLHKSAALLQQHGPWPHALVLAEAVAPDCSRAEAASDAGPVGRVPSA